MIKDMIAIQDALGNIDLRMDKLQALIQALIDFTGTDCEVIKAFDITANPEHFKSLVGLIEEYAGFIRADILRLDCEICESRAPASQG